MSLNCLEKKKNLSFFTDFTVLKVAKQLHFKLVKTQMEIFILTNVHLT